MRGEKGVEGGKCNVGSRADDRWRWARGRKNPPSEAGAEGRREGRRVGERGEGGEGEDGRAGEEAGGEASGEAGDFSPRQSIKICDAMSEWREFGEN